MITSLIEHTISVRYFKKSRENLALAETKKETDNSN